jgi:hypothetical protein
MGAKANPKSQIRKYVTHSKTLLPQIQFSQPISAILSARFFPTIGGHAG